MPGIGELQRVRQHDDIGLFDLIAAVAVELLVDVWLELNGIVFVSPLAPVDDLDGALAPIVFAARAASRNAVAATPLV